jgi:hypothetical protein
MLISSSIAMAGVLQQAPFAGYRRARCRACLAVSTGLIKLKRPPLLQV